MRKWIPYAVFVAYLAVCLPLSTGQAKAKSDKPINKNFVNSVETLPAGLMELRKEPTQTTKDANKLYDEELDWNNKQDFRDAQRGYVAPLNPTRVPKDYHTQNPDADKVVWDLDKYSEQMPQESDREPGEFLSYDEFPDAPLTVNPSLWRNAVLNSITGVFEVVDGVYQVRGYDLANMSFVRGSEDEGWIVIDPLTSAETAKAAIDVFFNWYYDGDSSEPGNDRAPVPRQVSAVIFTHSHADHYGGVEGLSDEFPPPVEGIEQVEIWVPEGFAEHAISENVIVGNAMNRRASYMYGPLLPKDPKGQVDGGLGKTTSSGAVGLRLSTRVISDADEDPVSPIIIAGIHIEFQNVPGTEAPAEMMFYFPDYNALCASEDVTHTFHNVLTLRGANVRDPLLWSKALDETLERFVDRANVIFASHHWPTWNTTVNAVPRPNRIREFIEGQRDLYKYIHDQSVRLVNQGFTIQEIGEMITLPDSLRLKWYNRDYYGTVNHNAKAVYQRYIGWFDGNPASLHQLPPKSASKKYIEYMGSFNKIMRKVNRDFDDGQYRWVAMVLNHIVYSGKGGAMDILGISAANYNTARYKLADTYEQLGYQAESGPWRNFYLTGAQELRVGILPLPAVQTMTQDVVAAMSLDMIFDYMAIHLKPVAGRRGWEYTFNLIIDKSEDYEAGDLMEANSTLYVKNGVLRYKVGSTVMTGEDATITMTRANLNNLILGEENVVYTVSGNTVAVDNFLGAMDQFEYWFNIVTCNDEENCSVVIKAVPLIKVK